MASVADNNTPIVTTEENLRIAKGMIFISLISFAASLTEERYGMAVFAALTCLAYGAWLGILKGKHL